MSRRHALAVLGPGILIAATGVGAGDLATAAFSGSRLGTAILWAVLVGALLKFALTEGLARWQLGSGETLLEGTVRHLGRGVGIAFLIYLLPWTFLVSAALMSACGAAAHAIVPWTADAGTDKILYGILHSLVGVGLVAIGGFRWFERIMSVCIGIMFLTVVITAAALVTDPLAILRGAVLPTIPRLDSDGLAWTVALIGGVGGTVTILCYGYWIRETGRDRAEDLGTCRLDLGVGYTVTAIFGMAMVVIGSRVDVEGRGVGLIVALASRLDAELGGFAKTMFLLGAWGAVASSLLGVWQAVPYLFADLVRELRGEASDDVKIGIGSPVYRATLLGMATVPIVGLWVGFASMQRAYAIVGASFLPLLALVLLRLGRHERLRATHRNTRVYEGVLVLTLAFFVGFLGMVIF